MTMQETPTDRRVTRIPKESFGKDHMICPNPNCGYRGDAKVKHAFPPKAAIGMIATGFVGVILCVLIGSTMESHGEGFMATMGLFGSLIPLGFVFAMISLIKQRVCPQCSMKVSN